jgi:hypothetical protein
MLSGRRARADTLFVCSSEEEDSIVKARPSASGTPRERREGSAQMLSGRGERADTLFVGPNEEEGSIARAVPSASGGTQHVWFGW